MTYNQYREYREIINKKDKKQNKELLEKAKIWEENVDNNYKDVIIQHLDDIDTIMQQFVVYGQYEDAVYDDVRYHIDYILTLFENSLIEGLRPDDCYYTGNLCMGIEQCSLDSHCEFEKKREKIKRLLKKEENGTK